MHILIVDKANETKRVADFGPTHVAVFQTTPEDTGEVEGVPAENSFCTKINKQNEASLATMGPLIDFIRQVPADARLLFRCDAGVSRSATGALLALCIHMPDVPVEEHFGLLRAHWPHVVPQRGMLRMTDDILGLKGKLVLASQADTAERMLSLPVINISPDGAPRIVTLPSRKPKSWRRVFKSFLLRLAYKL